MTGRLSLLLGLSLLTGCGESYQPTIRLVSYHSGDQRIASPAPVPPEEPMACPGAAAHPRISDQGEPGSDPKAVSEARAKLAGRARSKQIDPEAMKGSDSISGEVKEALREMRTGNDQKIRIGGMCLMAPKTWNRERETIAPVLAAFSLPRVPGDREDAQLTISLLGRIDLQSNQSLQGKLDEPKPGEGAVERLKIGGYDVVLEEISGKCAPSDLFSSPVSEGRYRVLNATVFIRGTAYSINCSGPEKTVRERASELRGFLQTMKSVD